jgi:hypothetical protein
VIPFQQKLFIQLLDHLRILELIVLDFHFMTFSLTFVVFPTGSDYASPITTPITSFSSELILSRLEIFTQASHHKEARDEHDASKLHDDFLHQFVLEFKISCYCSPHFIW